MLLRDSPVDARGGRIRDGRQRDADQEFLTWDIEFRVADELAFDQLAKPCNQLAKPCNQLRGKRIGPPTVSASRRNPKARSRSRAASVAI